MRTFPWAREPETTPRGVAVLLPGAGYTVQAPLLYWCAEMLVDAPVSGRRLVVGKSFGCFALPWAVRQRLPGVWLTPVLSEPSVAHALGQADSSHLAAAGDRDAVWLPEKASSTAARLVTVPDGDHGLTVATGWRDSVDAQTALLRQVAEHVRRL